MQPHPRASPSDDVLTGCSKPLLLRGDDVPRISEADVPGSSRGRIDHVVYDIDVTGLPPAEEPVPVDLSDLSLP
jgi:hypothetical protein